ncbi:MAG: VCBS repeat-containing protein [Candidatus Sumerlaeia bacterium]|nr:VCBS repeat-containing protein [Candidatus Sumerlaeia bacterium]
MVQRTSLSLLLCLAVLPLSAAAAPKTAAIPQVNWKHLSSTKGDIPVPGLGRQVATLIMDIDKDGVNDFVVLSYEKMAWFRRTKTGWERYMVEPGDPKVRMEAGGDFHDIDGDGDLDILQAAQSPRGEIWWWENPHPNFSPDTPWKRYEVIAVGGTHHDQMFGDFDGDGKTELVFWFNRGKQLYLAEIPADPKQPWPVQLIAQLEKDKPNPEGLAKADIDGDGVLDIVGGGCWFKHVGNGRFEVNVVDPEYRFTRSAAGDLIKGGRPEIVVNSGDGVGPLNLYQWTGKQWEKKTLIEQVDHGHSLQVGDINGDGNLDIYAGEMHTPGAGDKCRHWVLYGDGKGNFVTQLLSTGIGSHESKIGDLDGDGDLDILQKDFQKDQRVDVWLNEGTNTQK